MDNFNKVIKFLKIKSAVSLQLTPLEAQSRQRYFAIECVVSIALALKSIANSLADFIFKNFITLLKLSIGT